MLKIPRLPGVSRYGYDVATPITFLTSPNKLFNRYFSLNTEIFYIRLGRERWIFLAGSEAVRFFSKLTLQDVDPYEFRSRMYTLALPNFAPPPNFPAVAQETTVIIKEFFNLYTKDELTQFLINEVSSYIKDYSKNNSEIIPDLHNFIIRLSTNLYGKLFFGNELFSLLDSDMSEQYIHLDKNLSMLPLVIPAFRKLNKKQTLTKIKIEKYLLALVEAEAKNTNPDKKMNIVNGYLRIKDKFNISDENVVWLLHAMFWAAVHYTSVHGVWIGIKSLSDDEIKKNLLKEQNEYNELTPNSLNDMIYLGGTVKESLRKQCVFALPRRVLRDIEYNNYLIPKGEILAISPYIEHLNPKNFDEPNRYDPFRWCTNSINPQVLIPGGLGFFGCLGMDLASQLLKVIWAYLLENHDMKLLKKAPKEKFNLILLPPKNPVAISIKQKK